MKDIYAEKAISEVPRLLSLMDRNKSSSTYGCFSRDYWQDKVVDFPCAHMQQSVLTLALIYSYPFPSNIYYKNEKIKEWCLAGIEYWAEIQNSDGSFNEFYPNEHSLSTTGHTLYAVLKSLDVLKEKGGDVVINAASRAADWLAKHDDPATITNHQVVSLVALCNMCYIGDTMDKKLINAKLEKIVKAQTHDGGFIEYEGVDPGYTTLTISFLAKYYKLTGDDKILDVLKKAITFTSYFVYPNGTFAGGIGSRNTIHLHPHGFEILAEEIPLAGAIADKVLEGLKNGNMILIENMPDRYFSHYQNEFLQAWIDYKPRKEKVSLPFENNTTKYLDSSKMLVHRGDNYYLIAGEDKIKVFRIDPQELIFSDCGFTGELEDGRVVTSQGKSIVEYENNRMSVKGEFHIVPQQMLTPTKMIILRAGLLMMGKSNKVAYNVKNRLIKKLITANKTVPITYDRVIEYNHNLKVLDEIRLLRKDIKFKTLYICDEFSAIHVPSSNYFQKQELGTRNTDIKVMELNKEKRLCLTRIANHITGEIELKIS